MSEMYEIYKKHAEQYDELVRAEDYQNNLRSLLHEAIDWRKLSVIEAGVGTGRVTRLYIDQVDSAICCDRSPHMLSFAQHALAAHADKLRFLEADNKEFPAIDGRFDVFIEGWSFGHSASDCPAIDEVPDMTVRLVHNACKNIKPGGYVILLETLGTNTESPGAPHEKLNRYYTELENRFGFDRKMIRTDYKFVSVDEAVRVMGFFFGEKMAHAVRAGNRTIIPEWTGMWMKMV
ncbi:MAG: class I SAM-dependent methyltransferase [Spirochaetales bacterium]|jgi:SAM-dependent methyltransferase|nr:class I SAM-dependent methyltransferase [Spirochaetales bacterium]